MDEPKADGGQRAPLRVGRLVDSLSVPAWVERVVADMAAVDWIDLAVVVRNATSRPPRTFGQRLRSARKNFLYALYTRFDNRRNRLAP